MKKHANSCSSLVPLLCRYCFYDSTRVHRRGLSAAPQGSAGDCEHAVHHRGTVHCQPHRRRLQLSAARRLEVRHTQKFFKTTICTIKYMLAVRYFQTPKVLVERSLTLASFPELFYGASSLLVSFYITETRFTTFRVFEWR